MCHSYNGDVTLVVDFQSEYYTALQIQKAVTAYLKSKQLLPLGFAPFHLQTSNYSMLLLV